jgi:hypothetical protein
MARRSWEGGCKFYRGHTVYTGWPTVEFGWCEVSLSCLPCAKFDEIFTIHSRHMFEYGIKNWRNFINNPARSGHFKKVKFFGQKSINPSVYHACRTPNSTKFLPGIGYMCSNMGYKFGGISSNCRQDPVWVPLTLKNVKTSTLHKSSSKVCKRRAFWN